MFKYFLALALLLFGVASATAATWNVFNKAASDNALFFFDADSVIKTKRSVKVWIKYVNDVERPDSGGVTSVASRVEYSCVGSPTHEYFTSSTYGADGAFMRADQNKGQVTEIAPGSVAELIHAAVCTPDFPKNKSKALYYPVDGNDIFEHAKFVFKWVKDTTSDLAPK